MQAAQRVEYNHALEYSIRRANKLKVPVVVLFGIADNYPEANLRHYHFMLEGLNAFIRKKLGLYAELGNDPYPDVTSNMSP